MTRVGTYFLMTDDRYVCLHESVFVEHCCNSKGTASVVILPQKIAVVFFKGLTYTSQAKSVKAGIRFGGD